MIFTSILNSFFLFASFGTVTDIDTCGFHKINIDTPIIEITNFTEQYSQFSKNDSSDFQLISLSIPDNDGRGHLIYVNIHDSAHFVETFKEGRIVKRIIPGECLSLIEDKSRHIEKGGYYCVCDLESYRFFYYLCMIKSKEKVIFSYQGINKYISDLNRSDQVLVQNVIKLLEIINEIP
jgi:hypothetical protein